jgi:hypothetical protein
LKAWPIFGEKSDKSAQEKAAGTCARSGGSPWGNGQGRKVTWP